jgi:hypothetical protein
MRRARQLVAQLMDPALIRQDLGPHAREPFPGGTASRPTPSALQKLQKRLARGAGLRGARLAELALRAGLTPPAPHPRAGACGTAEAALWMALARENAALRREATKLVERKETIIRRIHRVKTRLELLRLKLLQRRLGVAPTRLGNLPPPQPLRQLAPRRHTDPAAATPSEPVAAGETPASAEPRRVGGEAAKPAARNE